MRDYRKLLAFQKADELALEIYRLTTFFPTEERFGLVSQLRRGAVSVPSNIVEGCARDSEADFVRFLGIAFGSLKEVEYQLSLAARLKMTSTEQFEPAQAICNETARILGALIKSLRRAR